MFDSILLRFRDLDTNSILEHHFFITRLGYVWWGWWKKLDEPDRVSELNYLQYLLLKGPIEIGLFDASAEGKFFSARLVQCVFNPGVPMLSPEAVATPVYYNTKAVAAWFKLTSLHPIAKGEESFERLFSASPTGENTLFPVLFRPSTGPSKLIGKSDFAESPIQVAGDMILHLSDIHFGEYAFPFRESLGQFPLEDILIADLNKSKSRIGVLIVSGDLTTKADANLLFDNASTFLRTLTDKLHLPRENVIIIPGNHDIPLRKADFTNYSHESAFKSFLKDFYEKNTEIIQLRRYQFPNGKKLEILTMNSVRLRSPEQMQYGYVQWKLYDSLLSSVSKVDDETIRLAVLHHHLTPSVRVETIDADYPAAAVSLTRDAGEIIEGLQAYGFRVVLHGHQHVPSVTKIARGRLQDDSSTLAGLDEPLYVIGAGSAGTSRLFPEMRYNTYSLISFDRVGEENHLRLLIRMFNASGVPRNYIKQNLIL
jgi:3',5'-cyclic AMP phosphodiesterase CpdA